MLDQDFLISKLQNPSISSQILLSKIRLIDEISKQTPAYQDPKYFPFFYHLGKIVQPVSFLEIGFDLGLQGACFLQSCNSVKKYTGFREKDNNFYSPRLGKINILTYFMGDFEIVSSKDDLNGKYDLVFVNQKSDMSVLEIAWKCVSQKGLLIVDYIHIDVNGLFSKFCGLINRDFKIFETRYGIGIIER